MKRLLIGLLSAIGFALPMSADNVISVSSPGGQPGDEVELTLSMQNTDDVVAAEIRIPLDQYVKYVDGSAMLNAERSNGHQISASGADNELRVYVYSIGNKPIKGNSGVLATVRLKLGNKAERLTLTPTTVLSNASGQSLAAGVQAGQVTILAPHLTVTTPQINYGHIPIRSTYTKTLTLKNTGTATLHVSDITFSASELSATDRSFSIEPNASHNVTVTYAPVKHGAINATATIMSDAINEENSAAIVADPYSVNELHIGNADGNSDDEVTVDVTMNNMEPIVAAQWSFTLPDALKYVEGSAISGTHAEGLSATAMLDGNKLTVYLYSQNNTPIPEGSGSIASFKVSLQGQSGNYYLTPSDITLSNIAMENMVSASTRGTVKIKSPKISTNSSLTMPEKPVTETVTQTFAIRNSGQAEMTVSKVTFLSEGFSIVEEMPMTIGANATKNITVQYQPTKAGSYSTTMQIYTNDPEMRMKSVTVSGSTFEPNSVTIDGAWAEDKSAYIANIAVENYTEIVAAQMDIHLPVGASVNDVANALTNADRLIGLSSTIAKIDDSTYRLVVFSFNNAHIKGNSGSILSVMIDVDDVYSMANKQILIDNIKLSSASGKDFSSVTEATILLSDLAVAEANAFKEKHTAMLSKTVDSVVSSDLDAINAALNDWGQLADAVKAKLVSEKTLLDALKAKAEELKAAEEADAAATAEANAFKTAYVEILGKTVETVVSADLDAITAALMAYDALSEAAKAKLVDDEKSLLDALKIKAEEPQYTLGDVNDDGDIDGYDLVGISNLILGTNTDGLIRDAADVNSDGDVDGYDYVMEVNTILGTNVSAAKGKKSVQFTNALSSVTVSPMDVTAGEQTQLTLGMACNGDVFTLVQTDVEFPDGVDPVLRKGRVIAKLSGECLGGADDHSISCVKQGNGKYRILIASQNNTGFTGKDGQLFTLSIETSKDMLPGSYGITLSNTKLVRANSTGVNPSDVTAMMVCNGTTGINGVEGDNADEQMYNLNGQRVSKHAQRGVYIKSKFTNDSAVKGYKVVR